MSVVGPDFEQLKRYNLEELRQPTLASDLEVNSVVKDGPKSLIDVAEQGSSRPA